MDRATDNPQGELNNKGPPPSPLLADDPPVFGPFEENKQRPGLSSPSPSPRKQHAKSTNSQHHDQGLASRAAGTLSIFEPLPAPSLREPSGAAASLIKECSLDKLSEFTRPSSEVARPSKPKRSGPKRRQAKAKWDDGEASSEEMTDDFRIMSYASRFTRNSMYNLPSGPSFRPFPPPTRDQAKVAEYLANWDKKDTEADRADANGYGSYRFLSNVWRKRVKCDPAEQERRIKEEGGWFQKSPVGDNVLYCTPEGQRVGGLITERKEEEQRAAGESSCPSVF